MDFIIISTADWDNPFWTNKQHIAKTLGDMGHRVLYIDSLGMRPPLPLLLILNAYFKDYTNYFVV